MATCARFESSLVGTVLKPYSTPDCASVAGTLVVLSPAEYAQLQSTPLDLSYSDGALVASAIVGVWCIGWAFKVLTRSLKDDGFTEGV